MSQSCDRVTDRNRSMAAQTAAVALLPLGASACLPDESPDASPPSDGVPPPTEPPTSCDTLGPPTARDALADPCTAGVKVFGPETFERAAGSPDEARRTFTLEQPGELCLAIDNGHGGRKSRLSAGWVEIDERPVVRPRAFDKTVESVQRRVRLEAGEHELGIRLASQPGASITVTLRASPEPALSRQNRAVQRISASLRQRADDTLGGLEPEGRASLLNTLAWYDESPVEPLLTRGARGQVTHLSARFLAFDVAPDLAERPSRERAEAFAAACDGGRALLALRDTDELALSRETTLGNGVRRFVFEQRWRGLRVHQASLTLDLDARGRLVRLDSSVVPNVDPPLDRLRVGRRMAERIALDHVRDLDEPLWRGVEPAVGESEQRVADRLPWTGDLDERLVWRVLVVPDGAGAGDREVLVDRRDGTVIASVERTKLLDGNDRVVEGLGRIVQMPPPRTGSVLWRGGDPCADVGDPPMGADADERDLDEITAAMCEADRLIAERGAEVGHPDFNEWFDPLGTGAVVAIGTGAGLSIGLNRRFQQELFLAGGAGRAEVLGHELMHTALGPSDVTSFTRGRGSSALRGAEGEAVEESLCDQAGAVLELRFDLRNEDMCLQADDLDTTRLIGMTEDPRRPCSSERIEREWRSLCEPAMDNGGWCEGAQRYGDIGYNSFDAYGGDGVEPSDFAASHTNLGVGNRAAAALLGLHETPRVRLDGWSVGALGRTAFERLLFHTIVELSEQTDWTRYGLGWTRASTRLFGSGEVSSEEHTVRTAHVAAGLWSVPREAQVLRPFDDSDPTTPPIPVAPAPLAPVTTATRPAVAQLPLPGGRQRTFVFYRPEADSERVRYVWADETRGGPLAAAPRSFEGPCSLPLDVRTFESPAAASSDTGVVLAWSEPTETEGVGRLRGAVLTSEAAGDVGCNDLWEPLEPAADRRLRGGPALAFWQPDGTKLDCSVLADAGILPPFTAVGPMGFTIEDCARVDEPPVEGPVPFDPGLARDMIEVVLPAANGEPGRAAPAPFDPDRPRPAFGTEPVEHTIGLTPLLLGDETVQEQLGNSAAPFGALFRASFDDPAAPTRIGTELSFGVRVDDPEQPSGSIETIALSFEPHVLVTAFRDEAGALRIVEWDNDTPTDDPDDPIPTLDPDPNPTDPALATVNFADEGGGHRFDFDFLYVVYGTSEEVGGVEVPTRLSYRVATELDPEGITEALFAPARRIDTIEATRGNRRQVNYKTARTLRAPVVAGSDRELHLFTVSLELPELRPDPDGDLGSPPDGADDERDVDQDRVRHATLEVRRSGELTWDSERPVVLLDTDTEAPSGSVSQVGAALVTAGRRQLRLYYPREENITVRSQVQR